LHSNPENPLVTFEPFVKALAIIYRGSLEEKCELVYGFFDLDGDNFVTNEEVRMSIRELFDSVRHLRHDKEIEEEAQLELSSLTENEVNFCIFEVVEQMFAEYAKKSKSILLKEEMQNYLYSNIKNILS
jgi:Ca2+-binding EF-hand superfamily protein